MWTRAPAVRVLERGTELVNPQITLGQTSRAREDELGQDVRPSAFTTTPSRVSFIACCCWSSLLVLLLFFFTLSFSILLGRKDACGVVA